MTLSNPPTNIPLTIPVSPISPGHYIVPRYGDLLVNIVIPAAHRKAITGDAKLMFSAEIAVVLERDSGYQLPIMIPVGILMFCQMRLVMETSVDFPIECTFGFAPHAGDTLHFRGCDMGVFEPLELVVPARSIVTGRGAPYSHAFYISSGHHSVEMTGDYGTAWTTTPIRYGICHGPDYELKTEKI